MQAGLRPGGENANTVVRSLLQDVTNLWIVRALNCGDTMRRRRSCAPRRLPDWLLVTRVPDDGLRWTISRRHDTVHTAVQPHGVHGMARQRELRVLVATDGSRDAQAAIATTLHFPWPARTRVRVISARRTGAEYRRSILLTALDRGAEKAAESARRTLSRRWPDVEIEVLDKTPVEGILGEAERFQADVIVVGWRGHGAVRRLLMGSVSRGVVRGSKCAVLVVRRSQRVRTIVVGVDGSEAAKRALALVGRLVPPRDGRVTLVSAVELLTHPLAGPRPWRCGHCA